MFLFFGDETAPGQRSGRNVSDPIICVLPLDHGQQLLALSFECEEPSPTRLLIPVLAPTSIRYGKNIAEFVGKAADCFPDAILPPRSSRLDDMSEDEKEEAIEHQLDLPVPPTPTIESQVRATTLSILLFSASVRRAVQVAVAR